jgi:hypothetical protein
MIVELVEMTPSRKLSRQEHISAAQHVVEKWQANPDLVRKHFLLDLDGEGGAGLYIWPSLEAAKKAHDADWRQAIVDRTGKEPQIRYFDMFMLIDNENGTVDEFPSSLTRDPAV